MSNFIPSFASINLYEFFQSLSSFIYTDKADDNLQKDVTDILNKFRIKSPDGVKPGQLVIIYECCGGLSYITPKYAKILSVSNGPGTNKKSYTVEIYDRENVPRTDLTPPYSTGNTHEKIYSIEIDPNTNELISSAVVTKQQQQQQLYPNDPAFTREVCMLFDYNDETLYDRIVAEFKNNKRDFYDNNLKGQITYDIDNKIQKNTERLREVKEVVNNYMLTEKSINEHIERLHLFSFKTPILQSKNKKKCKINSRNFTYDGLTFSSSLFLLEDVKDKI